MISFITPSTRCKNPKITEITLVFAVTTTTARLHCLFPQRRYKTSVSPQLGHLTGTDDRWLIREFVFSLFLPNCVHCQLLRALTPHFKSCTIPDCHLVGVGTLKKHKNLSPGKLKVPRLPPKQDTDRLSDWALINIPRERHLPSPGGSLYPASDGSTDQTLYMPQTNDTQQGKPLTLEIIYKTWWYIEFGKVQESKARILSHWKGWTSDSTYSQCC